MANEKNLIVTLHERRVLNFKQQFKSVVLEGLEIFGEPVVDEVFTDCKAIYKDFIENYKSSYE